jgi:hypothetical protein
MAWTPEDDGPEPHDYPRACCAGCRHLYLPERAAPWYRWLCMRAPAEPEYNPVTGKFQAEPPWHRCAAVNRRGLCDRFEAGPNDLDGPRRPHD